MTPAELNVKLDELRSLPHETEWVEFKHNNDFPQMIGEYLSAISNSAALDGEPFGYIVWGLEDGTHSIVGTTFTPRTQKGAGNEDLEPWLNSRLSPKINFRIFEFSSTDGHPMVMFEVQAANTAPVAFSGRRWIRVGSHKKPLSEHPERERRLWEIVSGPTVDWSAQICDGATIDDLDPQAIAFAREEFKKKFPKLTSEVDQWDDVTFLNKAKVTINGQITRTAIILLGKNEAEHFLSPAIVRITWILKDEQGMEKDYEHFGPPLILSVNQVFARVRNLTYRYMPDASLFPTEITRYDPWVIRETLHNCIAHQEYSLGGKIHVIEQADSALLFTNVGKFIPGSVEEVIKRDAPTDIYPNRFLAEAMVNLNMIDTIGSGIKRMFNQQRQRLFPLPDYDLSDFGRVKVKIIGHVIDNKYTRMLKANPELDMWEVIALDKVQKSQPISDEEVKSLREKKLVEGRKHKLHVSANVAAVTDSMVDYLKKRGIDKDYCRRMVVELLGKQDGATRKDIESLLLTKLSDALDEGQKKNFVRNLLQEMRRNNEIRVEGKGPGASWNLCDPSGNE